MPIAHGILEDHFGNPCTEAYSSGGSSSAVLLSYSGIYNWLYAVGFTTVFDIYNFVIACELLAVAFITLGRIHLIYSSQFTQWLALNKPVEKEKVKPSILPVEIVRILSKKSGLHMKVYPIFIWPYRLFLACFEAPSLRLNFHIGVLVSFFSIAWCGHLVHLAIAKGSGETLYPFYTGDWALYSTRINNDDSILNRETNGNSLHTFITWLGGLKSDTASLYLTDIAHHHLAVGVVFLWGGHVYSSLYKGFGHRVRDIFFTNGRHQFSPGIREVNSSLHLQVSIALAASSLLSSQAPNQLGGVSSSLTPYPYLSYDFVTCLLLYLHHSSIASLLMIGSFAHAGIFLVRDLALPFVMDLRGKDVIGRILAHKEQQK
jgi:photosystem I P700 chlorophyll a apoprotein A2